MRKVMAGVVAEAMYQMVVAKGFKGDREAFVALGLHQVSRNVEAYRVWWKAKGELNALKRR